MEELNGYFDDDGNQLNPDLIPKPGLCLTCKKILILMRRFFATLTDWIKGIRINLSAMPMKK